MAIRIALPSNTSALKGTTPICGITSITFGFGSVEDVDISSFCQPDDYRRFASGMKDAGEVSFTGMLDLADAGTLAVLADTAADPIPTDTYNVELGNGIIYSFTGYPRPLDMSASLGAADEVTMTFKVTGKPSMVNDTTTLF